MKGKKKVKGHKGGGKNPGAYVRKKLGEMDGKPESKAAEGSSSGSSSYSGSYSGSSSSGSESVRPMLILLKMIANPKSMQRKSLSVILKKESHSARNKWLLL